MLRDYFVNNLDVVFFIYGLVFVIIGVAILVQQRKGSTFLIAKILWLFVAYALIHAPADFLDMWSLIKGKSAALYRISQVLTFISYIFLFEFGRRLLGLIKKTLGWYILPILVCCVTIISVLSADFWPTANVLFGYFIRFPAGVMTGLGLIFYYNAQQAIIGHLKVRKYFYWGGAAFLAWSFFCGIVRARCSLFPANVLNVDTFLSAVKIPVHIFRTLSGLIIVWAISGMLRIFNWEQLEKLYMEISERKQTEDKLRNAFGRLKQTQLQLVRSEKLAAIGQLAAGAAHEINNPLFAISGETEMLLKGDHKNDRDIVETSKAILGQVGRIQGIIKRLLELSRRKEIKWGPLDINKLIEESIPLLGHQTKIEEIKIVKELASGLPEPLGDKHQIQEVFLNIMLNAVEAMDNRGGLTIKTYSAQISEYGRRKIDKLKLGQKIVVIDIKDTGKGMDDETLNKLFSPFFTTKEKGVGLGLFICYGIIDNHGGAIDVYSKLGEGSTFVIKLPVS